MTREEIKAQVYQMMVDDIQSVIKGEKENVSLLYCRPNDIIKYIVSLGGTYSDDFQTNGWQWDYWTNLYLNGVQYTLGGDGFYEDSAHFKIKK